ncbi:DUF2171 domain-containing protein [Roseomonas marmotae]|uniref:DUF2171 domain-containing protein n=1 Tax=Roseomonas marmotae TaxID=2768161 RepID=A0ABS3KB54_9PROT|nr:DUF2171 domain-containing protein [Roseomonas marmotae]MBO1073581.1 DUF2171 domain-containing protein [Roseomonas marmotae]QTI80238.1 DUF2171 domain-containing protein [Roseomonas marmotae]
MTDKSMIKEHAEILGSCGHHVGTVDELVGDFIKLTKDESEDGKHHYLPVAAVADIRDGKIYSIVNRTATLSMLQDNAEPGEPGSSFVTSS